MTTGVKRIENADIAAIDTALRRAAKAALALARKTKTPCYVWKDGEIVDIAAPRPKVSPPRRRSNAASGDDEHNRQRHRQLVPEQVAVEIFALRP